MTKGKRNFFIFAVLYIVIGVLNLLGISILDIVIKTILSVLHIKSPFLRSHGAGLIIPLSWLGFMIYLSWICIRNALNKNLGMETRVASGVFFFLMLLLVPFFTLYLVLMS